MKTMKKLLLFMVLAIVFIACGKKEEKVEVVAEKVYVIGTNAEYPPFESLQNGKIVGLDADIIEAVAEKLGIKYEWLDTTFDGLIPALQAKKMDVVIAGMSITTEREKAVNFSIPYLTSKVAFVVNKEKPYQTLEELKGKKFGAELGTTKEAAARKIEGAEVTPFSSSTGALMALKSGKIDAIVLDESVALNFIETNSELMIGVILEGEPKAIAFNKDDNELKEKFNEVLQELLNDGTIQKLREKYGV